MRCDVSLIYCSADSMIRANYDSGQPNWGYAIVTKVFIVSMNRGQLPLSLGECVCGKQPASILKLALRAVMVIT